MAQGLHYKDDPFLGNHEVEIIKTSILELQPFHSTIINCLWCDFSTTWYCAGGLTVDMYHIKQFKKYLLTDLEHG